MNCIHAAIYEETAADAFCSASHVFNFSKALKRCEIWFLKDLSISA